MSFMNWPIFCNKVSRALLKEVGIQVVQCDHLRFSGPVAEVGRGGGGDGGDDEHKEELHDDQPSNTASMAFPFTQDEERERVLEPDAVETHYPME